MKILKKILYIVSFFLIYHQSIAQSCLEMKATLHYKLKEPVLRLQFKNNCESKIKIPISIEDKDTPTLNLYYLTREYKFIPIQLNSINWEERVEILEIDAGQSKVIDIFLIMFKIELNKINQDNRLLVLFNIKKLNDNNCIENCTKTLKSIIDNFEY